MPSLGFSLLLVIRLLPYHRSSSPSIFFFFLISIMTCFQTSLSSVANWFNLIISGADCWLLKVVFSHFWCQTILPKWSAYLLSLLFLCYFLLLIPFHSAINNTLTETSQETPTHIPMTPCFTQVSPNVPFHLAVNWTINCRENPFKPTFKHVAFAWNCETPI